MALSLKDPETDSLARQVASLTGETFTEAVRTALRERLRNEKLRRGEGPDLVKELEDVASLCAALPVDFAIDAFRHVGKGRHPAGHNFGDCFSHALAEATGEPLLFKDDGLLADRYHQSL